MPTISFAEALARSEDAKRHLLLGNGFSIALFPDRFQYERLLDTADSARSPEARGAFDRLQTTDFEVVIKVLQDAVALLPLYTQDDALVGVIRQQAEALKAVLVNALAGRHPARPADITEAQYKACRTFLAHFVGVGRGKSHRVHLHGQLRFVALLDSSSR